MASADAPIASRPGSVSEFAALLHTVSGTSGSSQPGISMSPSATPASSPVLPCQGVGSASGSLRPHPDGVSGERGLSSTTAILDAPSDAFLSAAAPVSEVSVSVCHLATAGTTRTIRQDVRMNVSNVDPNAPYLLPCALISNDPEHASYRLVVSGVADSVLTWAENVTRVHILEHAVRLPRGHFHNTYLDEPVYMLLRSDLPVLQARRLQESSVGDTPYRYLPNDILHEGDRKALYNLDLVEMLAQLVVDPSAIKNRDHQRILQQSLLLLLRAAGIANDRIVQVMRVAAPENASALLEDERLSCPSGTLSAEVMAYVEFLLSKIPPP